jgi:TctA family transporter
MRARRSGPATAVAAAMPAGLALVAVAASALPAAAFAQTSTSSGDAATGTAVAGIFALWSVFFFVFYAAFWLLFILAFVLWVMAIVDVASRHEWEFPNALQGHSSQNDKVLWVLVVLLAGVIGAVVYYFMVMKPYPLRKVRPPMVPPGSQAPYQQQPQPAPPPQPPA